MAGTHTRPRDATNYLETEEDIAAYLQAAFEDGDPRLIAAALGYVARAKGMTRIAREAGLGRESLYKALSPDGNPEFATVLKVLRALGLRLHTSAQRFVDVWIETRSLCTSHLVTLGLKTDRRDRLRTGCPLPAGPPGRR